MAKKKKKQWDAMKAAKAARRKAHFANGGTLAMWRGSAQTFKDKKKARDRRACRGRVEV
jgi:hypothetical protein